MDIINHSFNVKFAKKYGIEEALIFNKIYFWCIHNANNKRNLYHLEGDIDRYWTYNSCEAFSKEFEYINTQKIRRVLKKLEELGFILVGNFNEMKYDRTNWYTITEAGEKAYIECCQEVTNRLYNNEESICQNDTTHFIKMKNGNDQNEKPIPTSITNSVSNTITTSLSASDSTSSSDTSSSSAHSSFADDIIEDQDKKIKEQEKIIAELQKALEKTKVTATSSFSKKDYSECIHIITDNRNCLKTKGYHVDETEYPFSVMNKWLKKWFTEYGVDKVKEALVRSVNGKFLVSNGYRMTALFSDKIFPQYISNTFEKLNVSAPVQAKTQIDYHDQNFTEGF